MTTGNDLQKAILNNIPDQAWLKDRDSRYILVNEAFVAACGLPESEILNKTPAQVWPVDWGKKYIDTDRDVVETGVRKRYEEWRHTEDGKLHWFDTIKTPIRDAAGEVVGTAGISRDITDRKQAEQELARLNRLYAVRSKTNQAIVRNTDREQLLRRVCQITVQSGGLALAWAGLFATDQASVQPAASFAAGVHSRRRLLQRLEIGSDAEFKKMQSPDFRYFVCNDARSTRKFALHAQIAQQQGFGSFTALQLRQDDLPAGIFMLYAQEPDFFTRDIVQLLRAIASDLSFALNFIAQAQRRRLAEQELLESRSQLRELSAYLQSVREEERTRIARELHDELGQSLTAIRIGLDVMDAQRDMGSDQWHKKIGSLKKLATSTIESVQRISADLRPLILDELGLTAAIDWLLESFSEHTGIPYKAELPGESLRFKREASTAMFRIVQESLTNIGRHSGAAEVELTLQEEESEIVLKITDNGKGMVHSDEIREKSLGLVGMRERAYMLGGKLSIYSRPGTGTSVEMRIPKAFCVEQGA